MLSNLPPIVPGANVNAGAPNLQTQMVMQQLMQMAEGDDDVLEKLFAAFSKQREQAGAETQAAKQSLEQAQDAPMPKTDSFADLVTRSLGGVASTFKGTDDPSKRAEELIKSEQQQLMMKRAENLKHLQDVYDRAADRAAKLGVLEDEQKFKVASQKAADTYDELLGTMTLGLKHELEMKQIEAKGKIDKDIAGVRASGKTAKQQLLEEFDPQEYLEESPISHVQFLDLSKLPTTDTKLLGSNFAAKNGIKRLNDREVNVVKMAGDAMNNIAIIEGYIPHLATSAADPKRAMNWLDARTQRDGSVWASYQGIRTAAIQFIQSIAGLGKGLRINQAEINAALKYDIPTETDTQEVARGKLELLSKMIKNVEQAALGIHRPNEAEEVRQFVKESMELHRKGSAGKKQLKIDADRLERESALDAMLNEKGLTPEQ